MRLREAVDEEDHHQNKQQGDNSRQPWHLSLRRGTLTRAMRKTRGRKGSEHPCSRRRSLLSFKIRQGDGLMPLDPHAYHGPRQQQQLTVTFGELVTLFGCHLSLTGLQACMHVSMHAGQRDDGSVCIRSSRRAWHGTRLALHEPPQRGTIHKAGTMFFISASFISVRDTSAGPHHTHANPTRSFLFATTM